MTNALHVYYALLYRKERERERERERVYAAESGGSAQLSELEAVGNTVCRTLHRQQEETVGFASVQQLSCVPRPSPEANDRENSILDPYSSVTTATLTATKPILHSYCNDKRKTSLCCTTGHEFRLPYFHTFRMFSAHGDKLFSPPPKGILPCTFGTL